MWHSRLYRAFFLLFLVIRDGSWLVPGHGSECDAIGLMLVAGCHLSTAVGLFPVAYFESVHGNCYRVRGPPIATLGPW